jgi:flagellar motility protein MotE (MotC chaperone)
MIRLLREFRLIPIVLIATGALFGLKVIGLFFNGSYLFGSRGLQIENGYTIALTSPSQQLASPTVSLETGAPPPSNKPSWMREMFGFPDVTGSVNSGSSPEKYPVTITGSSAPPAPPAPPPAPKEGASVDKPTPTQAGAKNEPKAPPVNGTVVPLDGGRSLSAAERAILERLQERRQELDKRARELDMREALLKEQEKKLEARANELKVMEEKGGGTPEQREKAENARLKSLATMYENMKAKDAAKIFDRLDLKVLIEMSKAINPRRMSEILAQMSPDAAEKLTSELAARATGGEKTPNPATLPKIEGRPNGS